LAPLDPDPYIVKVLDPGAIRVEYKDRQLLLAPYPFRFEFHKYVHLNRGQCVGFEEIFSDPDPTFQVILDVGPDSGQN